MVYLLEIVIFHGYVKSPDGRPYSNFRMSGRGIGARLRWAVLGIWTEASPPQDETFWGPGPAWIPDIMTSHQGRVPAPMQVQETEAVSLGCRWSSLFLTAGVWWRKRFIHIYIYIYLFIQGKHGTKPGFSDPWVMFEWLSLVLFDHTKSSQAQPLDRQEIPFFMRPGSSRYNSMTLRWPLKIVKRWYQTWLLQHEAVNQVVFL